MSGSDSFVLTGMRCGLSLDQHLFDNLGVPIEIGPRIGGQYHVYKVAEGALREITPCSGHWGVGSIKSSVVRENICPQAFREG